MTILTLAKEAWFVEIDEDDIEGFDIPWSRIDRWRAEQLQEERPPNDTEHNSEWPKSEVIQELNVKHVRFLLRWTVLQWLLKSMALILKGHVGLGAGLQNVLNAYK